jgi:hypothetical protein
MNEQQTQVAHDAYCNAGGDGMGIQAAFAAVEAVLAQRTEPAPAAVTDEMYVRSKWIDVSISNYHQYGKVELPVYWEIRFADGIAQSGYDTAAKAWSAAAEFTRRRLEEIRQVEREIQLYTRLDEKFWEYWTHVAATHWDWEDMSEAIREWCCKARILARELQVLAKLKRGLRTEETR